jgi:hypothetical protein
MLDPIPIRQACRILARIADAFDANELDDEARKWWGPDGVTPVYNTRRPEDIILYTGRGGKTLLTLADCIAARDALKHE